MIDNELKEYLEQMKNDICIGVGEVIDKKFEKIKQENREEFETMRRENREEFERMKEENKEEFDKMKQDMGSMKQEMDSMKEQMDSMKQEIGTMKKENNNKFKELLDQMNKRFDEQDKEIISIKRSIAVIEVDHGQKLDILYETRLDSVEREVENALRIQKLESRVQNLEYKQLGV